MIQDQRRELTELYEILDPQATTTPRGKLNAIFDTIEKLLGNDYLAHAMITASRITDLGSFNSLLRDDHLFLFHANIRLVKVKLRQLHQW